MNSHSVQAGLNPRGEKSKGFERNTMDEIKFDGERGIGSLEASEHGDNGLEGLFLDVRSSEGSAIVLLSWTDAERLADWIRARQMREQAAS